MVMTAPKSGRERLSGARQIGQRWTRGAKGSAMFASWPFAPPLCRAGSGRGGGCSVLAGAVAVPAEQRSVLRRDPRAAAARDQRRHRRNHHLYLERRWVAAAAPIPEPRLRRPASACVLCACVRGVVGVLRGQGTPLQDALRRWYQPPGNVSIVGHWPTRIAIESNLSPTITISPPCQPSAATAPGAGHWATHTRAPSSQA